MKNTIATLFAVTAIALAPLALRAEDPKPSPAPSASPAKEGVKYTCPMHPEFVSDKPGKCPKCGMTLVVKK